MNKKKRISLTAAFLALAMLLSACQFPAATQEPAEAPAQSDVALQTFTFPDFDPIWGTTAYPGEYSKGYDVTIDYAYSDRYFDFDSRLYNPSLATMSLCLELSSWSSYVVDSWPDKSHNAQKLFQEIGFTGYAQNDFWNDQPSLESIGAVIAHKVFDDCTLIALPVRGGNYYNEWGNNADVGQEGYHTGFADARDNVLSFLEDYITDSGITGRVKLWVVGYSRGGAVANLVAGYLNENPLPNGATLAAEDLYCYTFEAPQGALDPAIGPDEAHSNIHNIINVNDIVPMVAPVDWEFTRYNSTSRLIPTVTTAQFEMARDTMLEEFQEILDGAVTITKPDATAYRVSEYAKTIQVDFNPLNFLPSGEPLLQIQVVDDTRQTMNEMLVQFISSLIESVGSRQVFYDSLQSDLVLLLELLKGYETGFDMDAVIDAVLTAMTENDYENLKYVMAPAIQMNGATAQERIDQVVARLQEVLPQPEGFHDLYGTAGTLIQAIGTMLVNHPEDILDVALAFTNSNVMQAHHQELTLAWVRAGDPHYTDTPYTMVVPETLRTVRVSCPADVDVRVYDSQDTLVASVIGQVPTITNDVVGCAIQENGEIILHLPADEEYLVLTSAQGAGEVTITLSEYNVAHSRVTRVQNYGDISVASGDVLTLEAPNLVEAELTDEARQGSTAAYRLLNGSGQEIPCQESRGQDIRYHGVTVGQNSQYGMVSGGGKFLEGTYAQVTAQPAAGSQFEGWYAGGSLVSSDASYRFAPKQDTALTAHFSEPEEYMVRFTATGEGTVANADRRYGTGAQVQLAAEPAEGSEFDHWETSSGAIADASSAQTVLTVGQSDATVTAVFRSNLCPYCQRPLPQGTDHTADCGIVGHYTCDNKDHDRMNCGHYACTGGDHGLLDCGHRACAGGDHGAASCGAAGHLACDGKDHGAASCGVTGHFACDGTDHGALQACGSHVVCVGGDHGPATCGTKGHYVCDGKDHAATLSCGHLACAEGTHGDAPCGTAGHYGCIGQHDKAACNTDGHYVCDNADHTTMQLCGNHPVCVTGDHDAAPCTTEGHYLCDGKDHTTTLSCGHLACTEGTHGDASCGQTGHYSCDGNTHGSGSCSATLQNPTLGEFMAALGTYNSITVEGFNWTGSNISLQSGQSLHLIDGTMTTDGHTAPALFVPYDCNVTLDNCQIYDPYGAYNITIQLSSGPLNLTVRNSRIENNSGTSHASIGCDTLASGNVTVSGSTLTGQIFLTGSVDGQIWDPYTEIYYPGYTGLTLSINGESFTPPTPTVGTTTGTVGGVPYEISYY